MSTTPLPFIKWVGGKRSFLYKMQVPKKIKNYHEPFLGGGAVFFAINNMVEHAFISDINERLINTYQVIQKYPDELINWLRHHEDKTSKEEYYKMRNLFNEEQEDKIKLAGMLIYLMTLCFKGAYRENSKGKYNVPYGYNKRPKILNKFRIRAAHIALQRATITCCDFKKAFKNLQQGDFLYCDPPYYPLNEISFVQYNKKRFPCEEHVRLRDALLNLKDVNFLCHNSFCGDVYDLYHDKGFAMDRILSSGGLPKEPLTQYSIKNYSNVDSIILKDKNKFLFNLQQHEARI